MIPSLKAEFRKLLSTRSTYLLVFIAFLLSAFVSFWVYGYKDVEHAGFTTGALLNCMLAIVTVNGLFLSFLAVLLVGHEYRYNLIMYTLTGVRRRTTVFFTKLLAVCTVAFVAAATIVLIGIGLFHFGQNLHHITTAPQYIPVFDFIWRGGVNVLISVMLAFFLTMLLRSLVAGITIILVMPTTVEPLLGLLLKDNTKYLPYTALGNITNPGIPISHVFSLKVLLVYVVALGLLSYLTFLKRDAN